MDFASAPEDFQVLIPLIKSTKKNSDVLWHTAYIKKHKGGEFVWPLTSCNGRAHHSGAFLNSEHHIDAYQYASSSFHTPE